jgi:hypothetical protein
MLRAAMCSSSGGQLYEYNFWYNHSVFVAVRSSPLNCVPDGHEHRAIISEFVFTQLSSWGWAHSCSKHVNDSNKCIIEKLCVKLVTDQNNTSMFMKFNVRGRHWNHSHLYFSFQFQFFVLPLEAGCMIQKRTANRIGLLLSYSRACKRQNNCDKTNNLTVVTLLCRLSEFSLGDVTFNISIYLSGLVTAVAVFRNPNAIPFCLTTDLLLNVLLSWLLVHLPSTSLLSEA